jgi:hypothetical protein
MMNIGDRVKVTSDYRVDTYNDFSIQLGSVGVLWSTPHESGNSTKLYLAEFSVPGRSDLLCNGAFFVNEIEPA